MTRHAPAAILPDQIVLALLQRPIAFHPALARLGGSVNAGLFLSQAFYWQTRTTDPTGWFYKTQAEWQEETTLTRREQEKAREKLRRLGVLEEERRAIPAKLYFRIHIQRLTALLSSMAESAIQECTKPPFIECTKPPYWPGGLVQSGEAESANLLTETTPEITPENTTTVSHSGNGTSEEIDAGETSSHGRAALSPQSLMALYNTEAPPTLPKVKTLTEARIKKATGTLRQFPQSDFWQTVLAEIRQSAFLQGLKASPGHEHFRADFDWLLTKGKDGTENCVKVFEGKFRDGATPKRPGEHDGHRVSNYPSGKYCHTCKRDVLIRELVL
jgi:hypothetical protein